MKFLAVILSLMTFSAQAAVLRLTVDLDGMEPAAFKKAKVIFESTNKSCQVRQMTGSFPITVKKNLKLSKNRVEVEAQTVDPQNDKCQYRFESIYLPTDTLLWASISSTRTADYGPEDAMLEIVRNSSARLDAVCKKNSQCQKSVNGVKVGYPSNAVVFYADQKAMDQAQGQYSAHILIKAE